MTDTHKNDIIEILDTMSEQENEAIDKITKEFRKDLVIHYERVKAIHITGNAVDILANYKRVIADYFGDTVEDIFSISCREEQMVLARGLLVWLCRNGDTAIPWGSVRIAKEMGYKNHSSVIHATSTFKFDVQHSRPTRKHLAQVLSHLGFELVEEKSGYTSVRIK